MARQDDIDIDYPKVGLLRPLEDGERAAYERDGAAIVRGIVPPEWIELMREAVTRLMERPDPSSQNYAAEGQPRFFAQAFPWLLDDAFKAWVLYGPLAELAHQAMPEARSINFFYDQIFAKEPGTSTRTPWHQDVPYLPLAGDQVLRVWVALDPVTTENGAVHYLRGSHRWNVIYHPIGFKPIAEITDAYRDSQFADQPDFEADYDRYDWLVGEAEPGDVMLHHPCTVHGSREKVTTRFRRAVTNMYAGDRVTWNPHPANMFKNKNLTGHVEMPDLEAGGPIDCELFPRVWTAAASAPV